MKTTLLKAINAAGALVKEKFHQNFEIRHKDGINNLVTEVDEAAEKLIIQIIKEEFPVHGFVGEEYGTTDANAEWRWIIDPIDGTVNFAHGVPLCCISIALMKGETLQLGAVFNPMMNELFFAEKGKGAFLNNQKISVSSIKNFDTAFLVTGFPYHVPSDSNILNVFSRMVEKGLPVRRLGSAALDLCWVACGRFDGFWENNLNAWDIAAGYLIVQEAGGKVSNFSGDTFSIWDKQTLATNGKIHEALRNAILKID